MFDTIRLRFYGINDVKQDLLDTIKSQEVPHEKFAVLAHHELYMKIMNYRGKNVKMKAFIRNEKIALTEFDDSEAVVYENSDQKLNVYYQVRNQMYLRSEKEVKKFNLSTNGTYRVPSSQSDVTFSVNENGGYMDFEFSIPKYLFGHSVAQCVPQALSSTYFKYGERLNSMSFQIAIAYERLQKIIDQFLSDLCALFECELLPDKRYIELRRLDICYNQHFESKEVALQFLEMQKRIQRKNMRKTDNAAMNYWTSINYKTSDGGYFKIYHKGTEYAKTKGDREKHLLANKKWLEEYIRSREVSYELVQWKDLFNKDDQYFAVGKDFEPSVADIKKYKKKKRKLAAMQPYDVKFIKREADKILRYEFSFAPTALSNFYKRRAFRKDDAVHKQNLRRYNKCKNLIDKKGEKAFAQIDTISQKSYHAMHSFLNTSASLVLSPTRKMIDFEKSSKRDYNILKDEYRISKYSYRNTLLANRQVGYFSPDLLAVLFDRFNEMFDHYQVKRIKLMDDLADRIDAFNKQAKKKAESYNSLNRALVELNNRKARQFPSKFRHIKKATDLLTENRKIELGLKTVHPSGLLAVAEHLKQGLSLENYFIKARIKGSGRTRIRKNMALFDIYENTLVSDVDILPDTGFATYYWNTSGIRYRSRFFSRLQPPGANKHWNYE